MILMATDLVDVVKSSNGYTIVFVHAIVCKHSEIDRENVTLPIMYQAIMHTYIVLRFHNTHADKSVIASQDESH